MERLIFYRQLWVERRMVFWMEGGSWMVIYTESVILWGYLGLNGVKL